eukprot:COSAG05_NODE_2128_length_3517_cov_7.942657_2_plen_55_part_00
MLVLAAVLAPIDISSAESALGVLEGLVQWFAVASLSVLEAASSSVRSRSTRVSL